MLTSESQVEISKALAAFNKKMEPVKKGSANTFFKSNYADLADIKAVADPLLAEHGLAIVQHPEGTHEDQVLTTRLMHESGEWQESSMPLYIPKADAQSQGSALTYGRRYAYSAVVGIATEDDDGQLATDHGPVTRSTGVQPGSRAAKDMNVATDAQWKYLAKLTDQSVESTRAQYGEMNAAACSTLIDSLKEAA